MDLIRRLRDDSKLGDLIDSKQRGRRAGIEEDSFQHDFPRSACERYRDERKTVFQTDLQEAARMPSQRSSVIYKASRFVCRT